MRKMKRFAALMLTLLMVAGLTSGCIKNYVTSSEVPTAAPTTAPTAAPTAAPTKSSEAPGASTAAPTAAPTEPAPTKPDLAGTKLEIWYAVSGNSGEKFQAISKAFAEANGVELEMSYSGGSADTATKVSAALLTDTYPDVALMYAGPLYTGERNDFFVGEQMEADPEFDKADIFEGMLDYCVYMGNGICAAPYGISTQVLYYNKDILKAAGVDMTNPPKTWAEFKEVCKTVLEKGNVNGTADFKAFDTSDEAWLFKSMLMQNGCSIVEKDGDKITAIFNDAKAVEVGEYWESLVTEGIMAAAEHNNAENKFLSGNLAFMAASSNRISRWYGTTSFELGAIEMPYFNQPSLALGGNVLVILTQDPVKRAAAWEYVKYMTDTGNSTDFALSTGYLPTHKSAVESDACKAALASNELYGVAFRQLDYTWAYTHFSAMGTMDTQIKSALGKLEKGRGTSADLLDKAVKAVQKEIDDQ